MQTILDMLEQHGTEKALEALGAVPAEQAASAVRIARLFSAAVAERLLPRYEQAYPQDLRPRQAIAAGRRMADGDVSHAAAQAGWDARRAMDAAWRLAEDRAAAVCWIPHPAQAETAANTAWVAAFAAQAAAAAASVDNPLDGALDGYQAARHTMGVGEARQILHGLLVQ